MCHVRLADGLVLVSVSNQRKSSICILREKCAQLLHFSAFLNQKGSLVKKLTFMVGLVVAALKLSLSHSAGWMNKLIYHVRRHISSPNPLYETTLQPGAGNQDGCVIWQLVEFSHV